MLKTLEQHLQKLKIIWISSKTITELAYWHRPKADSRLFPKKVSNKPTWVVRIIG